MSLKYLCIIGIFLVFSVYNVAGRCDDPCGSNCCKYDETCEKSIDGGTCFKKSDKISCSSFFYCYQPTSCCGFGTCCPEGSYCKDSLCYTNDFGLGTYSYVGIVCGSITLLALFLGISLRVSRARRARQARIANGMMGNSPFSTTPIGVQPPPYSVTTVSSGQTSDQQSTFSGPNAYSTAYGNAGFSGSTKIN